MPLARKFRLYAVTIHDKTTRECLVPEHEIGVIKAAWRGTNVTATITNDVREIVTDPAHAYQSLKNRYKVAAVEAFFPGPERLEQDMAVAADKTDAWLLTVASYQESEDKRIRALAKSERERVEAEAAAQAEADKKAGRVNIDAKAGKAA